MFHCDCCRSLSAKSAAESVFGNSSFPMPPFQWPSWPSDVSAHVLCQWRRLRGPKWDRRERSCSAARFFSFFLFSLSFFFPFFFHFFFSFFIFFHFSFFFTGFGVVTDSAAWRNCRMSCCRRSFVLHWAGPLFQSSEGPRFESASALLSLQKLWSVDSLVIVSFTINETLKWLSSLPILMPAGLLTGGDSVSSDIYIIPLPPPYPFSPSLISLISLTVSVDVKHHMCLLTVGPIQADRRRMAVPDRATPPSPRPSLVTTRTAAGHSVESVLNSHSG